MTLKEKLHKIYETVDRIEKAGYNSSQKYAYVKATDVTRVIREKLIELKVYAEINFNFVGGPFTVAREKAPTAPFTAVMVKCDILFHDLESAEVLSGSGLGTGCDTNDKSAYKAQTGALKYALKNAFLVPDEPGHEMEPEADESVDERSTPDAYDARHAAPNPLPTPKAKKPETRPTPAPAAPVSDPVGVSDIEVSIPSSAPVVDVPSTPEPVAVQAAAPEHGDAYEGPDDELPTEAELTVYRTKFSKLGDALSTDGKLKSSKGLPINRKLLVFLLGITKASDAKTISRIQWDDFFARVDAAQALENGLVGLGKLVNKYNGLEEKK